MKENFPNLEKEIDMKVQEAERVPKKLDLKKNTSRNIIFKLHKIKDKERILNARFSKRKGESYLQRTSQGLLGDFSKETLRIEGAGKKYSKS